MTPEEYEAFKKRYEKADMMASFREHEELKLKYTALEDGLRSKCDQWWRTEDPLARIIAREVRALLGKEKESD